MTSPGTKSSYPRPPQSLNPSKCFHLVGTRRLARGQWSHSTISGGGGSTIPPPRMSPEQPLLGIGLYVQLHERQACPKVNSFHEGVGQTFARDGLLSYRPLPERGQIFNPSPPSPSFVERLGGTRLTLYSLKMLSLIEALIRRPASSCLATTSRKPESDTHLMPRWVLSPVISYVLGANILT